MSQYSDVTLGLLYLITIVCLTYVNGREKHAYLFYSGFIAGSAAWTKNEGIPFFILVVILVCISNRKNLNLLRFLILGFVIPITTLIIFKQSIAPPRDLMSGLLNERWKQVLEWDNYIVVIKHFSQVILSSFPILVPCVILALIFMNITEYKLFGVLLITLFIYVFMYLITPYELKWHLSTSCNRLIMQIYPSFFFLATLSFNRYIISSERYKFIRTK